MQCSSPAIDAMKKLSLPIATALLASGCGSAPAPKSDLIAGDALRDQTLGYTVRSAPPFSSLNSAQALTNKVIDAAGSMVAATRLSPGFHATTEADAAAKAASYGHIVDPARDISQELVSAFEAAKGARRADGVLAVPDAIKVKDIARAARGRARYMLDVETEKWGLSTFATDWFHYDLHYQASARLIDTESGAVVASGVCKDKPDDKARAPNFDQLMIDNAALLKSRIATAALECVATLKAKMLR
ncbi:hypothetical protein SAMN05428948_0932 [Massilia sp. CF038]|nr:hypothetical protein SAMN05428948_0932 [Massilia sp. CF038]